MSVPPETTPPESSRREPKRPKLVFFVDANVLLELYGALDPRVDEVAPKLLEVGESLFLPRQIADEVERGKLRVAQDASQRVLAGLKAPSPKLPVGLHQHGAALRSAVETLKTTIEEVQKSAADYVEAVAESRDGLSVALAPLLANATTPSADAVALARGRRERGNPPGKANGPLGDQLAWEQLLAHVKDADMVWLVTGDRDFASGTPLCLNPLLFRELRTVAPNAVVRLYGKSPGHLVQAVNNFFDERGLADARFSEEQIDYFDHLAEIAEREREPWQCGRGDGSNTPIEDATCADCGAQLEQALREEQYAVRRVADGYEIELLDDRDGAAPGPERCGNCPSTTFEIEFESLCSYCKRVLGSC